MHQTTIQTILKDLDLLYTRAIQGDNDALALKIKELQTKILSSQKQPYEISQPLEEIPDMDLKKIIKRHKKTSPTEKSAPPY